MGLALYRRYDHDAEFLKTFAKALEARYNSYSYGSLRGLVGWEGWKGVHGVVDQEVDHHVLIEVEAIPLIAATPTSNYESGIC